MKKVIKVTDTELVLDDGSVVGLLFELDSPLTPVRSARLAEPSARNQEKVKDMNVGIVERPWTPTTTLRSISVVVSWVGDLPFPASRNST